MKLLIFHYSAIHPHFASVAGSVWLLYDSDKQGVVDDVVVFEELGVFGDDGEDVFAFSVLQVDRCSLFEIVVLFSWGGIFIDSLSAEPRALDIVSLDYFFACVEDICHDDEVTPTNLTTALVLLYQLVQAEEFSNQRLWVSLDVVVIILQDIA